jgi:hypothetical protein
MPPEKLQSYGKTWLRKRNAVIGHRTSPVCGPVNIHSYWYNKEILVDARAKSKSTKMISFALIYTPNQQLSEANTLTTRGISGERDDNEKPRRSGAWVRPVARRGAARAASLGEWHHTIQELRQLQFAPATRQAISGRSPGISHAGESVPELQCCVTLETFLRPQPRVGKCFFVKAWHALCHRPKTSG